MLGLLDPESIAIVVLAAIVIFGGARVPQLARSLGRAKSEFKKGIEGQADTDSPAHEASGNDASTGTDG